MYLYIITAEKEIVNFNKMTQQGKKASASRTIKRQHQQTLSQYLDCKYGKDIGEEHRCNICNSIIKPVNFVLESNKDGKVVVTEYTTPESKYLCYGSESDVTKNCKANRKGLNPNSVEFIMLAHNIKTTSEALEILHKKNKSPFYRKNHPSDIEYKKSQRRNLEWFEQNKSAAEYDKYRKKLKYTHSEQYYIDLYGKEEGQKHWKQMSKQKVSCSLDAKILRYGSVAGNLLYQQHLEKSRQTKEMYITRYSKATGVQEWQKYCEKSCFYNKEKNPMCIEYYYAQGLAHTHAEQSRLNFIASRVVFSKQYCIDKYGKEKGLARYRRYQERQASAVGYGKSSKESLINFFNEFILLLPDNLRYYIGIAGNKEYFLFDDTHKMRLFDFTIPELKIIIEYHGSLWHYNPQRLLKSPYETLSSRNQKDIYKKELAESYGYDYYVVFDTDKFVSKQQELIKIIKEKYENK